MRADLECRFGELGGRFVVPAGEIAARLRRVRALMFDWDGVFNPGAKGAGAYSGYSEPDSMGTNLLRFALWRALGAQPACAVLSGADNPAAREFAKREHLHDVYSGMRDKRAAFAAFARDRGLEADEVAYLFDDVNDLAVARGCGVRILVRRNASPLLVDHAVRHGLCDYVTAHEGGGFAVREACELLLGLLDSYEAVVTARSAAAPEYEAYYAERQSIVTELHDER